MSRAIAILVAIVLSLVIFELFKRTPPTPNPHQEPNVWDQRK
jgi:hypothetical protein